MKWRECWRAVRPYKTEKKVAFIKSVLLFCEDEWHNIKEICEAFGVDKRTVSKYVKFLVKKGLLLHDSDWKHDYFVRTIKIPNDEEILQLVEELMKWKRAKRNKGKRARLLRWLHENRGKTFLSFEFKRKLRELGYKSVDSICVQLKKEGLIEAEQWGAHLVYYHIKGGNKNGGR